MPPPNFFEKKEGYRCILVAFWGLFLIHIDRNVQKFMSSMIISTSVYHLPGFIQARPTCLKKWLLHILLAVNLRYFSVVNGPDIFFKKSDSRNIILIRHFFQFSLVLSKPEVLVGHIRSSVVIVLGIMG